MRALTRLDRRCVLLVLALTTAANAPSLRWPFLNDDWALLHTFQSPGAFQFWITPIRTPLYRPVSWGGLALQHSLFGLHPLPYHLVALACVLGAAVTLYATARRVGLRPGGALITGVAFGVHPALAFGVGWFCCIGSPMGQLFASLALFRLVRPSPRLRDHLWGVLLLLLAIGSHETFAVLPAVVLLLRLGTNGLRLKDALLPTLPGWIVAGSIVITQSLTRLPEPPSSTYYAKVLSPKTVGDMFTLLQNLTGVASADPDRLSSRPYVIGAAIAWALLVAGAVAAARTGRWLALLGLLATVPCTVPPSILINQFMNPYYLELALLPFALAVGTIGQTLLDAHPLHLQVRRAVPVVLVAALVGGIVMTDYWSRSFLGKGKVRQDQLVAEVRQRYGDAPPAVVELTGSQQRDSQITYRGYMFGVLYGDPGLKVVFGP